MAMSPATNPLYCNAFNALYYIVLISVRRRCRRP